MERTYLCCDLKSYYASVECIDRGLDPMAINLVVADAARTDKNDLPCGIACLKVLWHIRQTEAV